MKVKDDEISGGELNCSLTGGNGSERGGSGFSFPPSGGSEPPIKTGCSIRCRIRCNLKKLLFLMFHNKFVVSI